LSARAKRPNPYLLRVLRCPPSSRGRVLLTCAASTAPFSDEPTSADCPRRCGSGAIVRLLDEVLAAPAFARGIRLPGSFLALGKVRKNSMDFHGLRARNKQTVDHAREAPNWFRHPRAEDQTAPFPRCSTTEIEAVARSTARKAAIFFLRRCGPAGRWLTPCDPCP
jgi:hypothetical protein